MSLQIVNPPNTATLKSDVDGNEHLVHHRDTDRPALLAALETIVDKLIAAPATAEGQASIIDLLELLTDGIGTSGALPVEVLGLLGIDDPALVNIGFLNGVAPALNAGAVNPGTLRIVHASNDPVVQALAGVLLTRDADTGEYETVAASASDQVLGATGGAGDLLTGLLIVPANTSPGVVQIKDGSGTAITVFAGGASSVSNLVPFYVPLNLKALTNWKVTTGTGVSVIASGNFT